MNVLPDIFRPSFLLENRNSLNSKWRTCRMKWMSDWRSSSKRYGMNGAKKRWIEVLSLSVRTLSTWNSRACLSNRMRRSLVFVSTPKSETSKNELVSLEITRCRTSCKRKERTSSMWAQSEAWRISYSIHFLRIRSSTKRWFRTWTKPHSSNRNAESHASSISTTHYH
jgi:hypothetical protein